MLATRFIEHLDHSRLSPATPQGQATGTRCLPGVLKTSELRVTWQFVTRQHRELVQSIQGLGKEIFHYPVRGWAFFIASIKIFKT